MEHSPTVSAHYPTHYLEKPTIDKYSIYFIYYILYTLYTNYSILNTQKHSFKALEERTILWKMQ